MISEEAIAHHAALSGAVRVKPLVWQEKAGESYRQANSAIGMYQVSWLGEIESWQLYCPVSQGRDWRENFSRHSSSAEAKAAAQADYEARILSALEPAACHHAERAELARQNAALRAQVASLTADNEALQRTVARLRSVGLKFHSACTSAWASGEPQHKVLAMLDAADEFADALTTPDDPAAKIGGDV